MTTSFYEELRKSDMISDENENAQSRVNIDKWIFRLLLFLIGFMPLIVMANVEEVISPLVSNVDALSSGAKGDLFTHYKTLLILIITVITGAMLLVKVLFMGGEIRRTFLNYVLGIFAVAIIVSTIASPNISIALNGYYNRSDGAISWLSYIALMFIAMNIEYPKKVISYIMYTIIPFVFINLYIITMNFNGKDLLQNTGVQKLVSIMLPEGANLSESSILVGTLNQWNYMSGMFAMLTVMYLAWAVTSHRWYENIVGAVTASAAITVMFMSISTSGFLTLLLSIPFIIVAIVKFEYKKKSCIALLIFLIISAPAFHILSIKNEKIWNESFGFLLDNNPYHPESIGLLMNTNVVYASEQSFVLPVLPEKAIAIGSGRSYIWNKTIGLVKERAMLGFGADSLVYNFPHYNIESRSGLGDENIITDKPHNLYVGTLFGFGLIGFFMIVIIAVNVLINTVCNVFRGFWSGFILALTSGAYFVQAMFNDSIPSISAFVFVIIGIMLSLIFNLKKEIT